MSLQVLFFTSPTCGFCPFIEDILRRIVAEVDHLELKVIDVTEDIKAAEKYEIVAIPTIVLPNNQRLIGGADELFIREQMKFFISMGQD